MHVLPPAEDLESSPSATPAELLAASMAFIVITVLE